MQAKRLDRVNQLIKEESRSCCSGSSRIRASGFVTVTEVETTSDLRLAKIFVSVLGSEEQWAASLAALASAKGFIRSWSAVTRPAHDADPRVPPPTARWSARPHPGLLRQLKHD